MQPGEPLAGRFQGTKVPGRGLTFPIPVQTGGCQALHPQHCPVRAHRQPAEAHLPETGPACRLPRRWWKPAASHGPWRHGEGCALLLS